MESWEEDKRINTAEPTREEIKIALRALKVAKAQGIDNTSPPPPRNPKIRFGNICKNIIPSFQEHMGNEN
jgi:hypothetical protein